MSKCVFGVGSVGQSTLFFLKSKNNLPAPSFLFVSTEFEKKVREKSKDSIAAKKKFNVFKTLKDANIVIAHLCTYIGTLQGPEMEQRE